MEKNTPSNSIERSKVKPPGQASTTGWRIFSLAGVTKQWAGPTGFTLNVAELSICVGEKIALVGYSGCGKSTLLDLLAMILKPDHMDTFDFYKSPDDRLDVADTWSRGDLDSLAHTRMHRIGYILQTGGLLPFLSVRENIGLNCRGLGLPLDPAVEPLAEKLGIARHLDKLPRQLSVGERQRVAVARAMAHEPTVVIADEPTASLDPINADEIMKLFTRLVDETGVSLIVATHDWERVDRLGFRKLTFDLVQEAGSGTVQATVSGGLK